MRNFIVFAFLFIWPCSIHAMDEEEYEKWIHNIYLKYYKNPVSHSEWSLKIQSLPKQHKLKHKDNFWDLSGDFFKNSLYWSKMWVANPKVENPHRIYRGDTIKFDHQSLANVNTSKHSVDIKSQFPGLVVPKHPSAKRSIHSAKMPSSLPELLRFRPEFKISLGEIQEVNVNKRFIVPSYVTRDPPSPVGEVISKDGYGKFAALGGERLIVKIENARSISIGSVFTVFKNKGHFGGLLNLSINEIAIKGRIRIISYIKKTDSLFFASVIEALDQITPEDSLLQGEPPNYNFSQTGSMGSADGQIMGTPNKHQKLLGLGSIVYLNRGSDDGIHKEQFFYIQGNTKRKNPFERPYQYKQPLLGKMQIIHSASDISTGVIVSTKSQIYVGDLFSPHLDSTEDLSRSKEYELVDPTDASDQEKDLLIEMEEVEETLTEEDEAETADENLDLKNMEETGLDESLEAVGYEEGTEDGEEDAEDEKLTKDFEDEEGDGYEEIIEDEEGDGYEENIEDGEEGDYEENEEAEEKDDYEEEPTDDENSELKEFEDVDSLL